MRRKWKKAAFLLALAVVLGGCAGSCGVLGDEKDDALGQEDDQVFQVGSEVCSLSEARVFLTNYQNIYGTMYEVDLWKHDFGDADLEQYVKDLTISQLAQIMAMDELAEEQEIALTEEEEKKTEDAAKAYYESLNQAEKEYMGVDEESIARLYRQYGLANKLYAHLTASVNSEVSDDEARIMEAMQIFVTRRETADAVEARLSDGSDFASVASAYNEADRIEITFGRGDMPQAVEDVAFSLESGEVSQEIQTGEGYYFIKCINNYNQKLTDENKQVILENRRKATFGDTYNAFVKELPSRFNQELWDKIRVEVREDITTRNFFEIYEEYCGW